MAKLIINDKDGNVLYSHPSVDEVKLAKLKGAYPFDANVVMQPNWETTDPIVVQMSNLVTGKINLNNNKRYQDIVNLANSSAPVFAAPPASGGGPLVIKTERVLNGALTFEEFTVDGFKYSGTNKKEINIKTSSGASTQFMFTVNLSDAQVKKFLEDLRAAPAGTALQTLAPAGNTVLSGRSEPWFKVQ